VVLAVHPAVEEATRDGRSWEESPALAALAQQAAFLNELQGGVNQWTASLRRATRTPRLETMPATGSAAEEMRFWEEAEQVLGAAETRLAAPVCQAELEILRRAKVRSNSFVIASYVFYSGFTRRSRWTRSWPRCGPRWSVPARTADWYAAFRPTRWREPPRWPSWPRR
jgi:hypothetical protein